MQLTSIKHLEIPGALILEQSAKLHELYDSFLDNFEDPHDHEREAGVHASEVNTCKRQVVYTLFSTEKKANVERMWRKKFEVGKALHDMIQKHFVKMAANSNGKFTFEAEVRVQDTPLGRELCLCSSCDGIFTFFENGQPYLRVALEIKSKSAEEYKKLKKPEEKHEAQSHLYMAALDIPLVWYLYWDKGTEHYTPSMPPYLTRFNPVVWERMRQRSLESLKSADDGVLPNREEGIHCRWCPYAWTCGPSNATSYRNNAQYIVPIAGRR